MCFFFHGVFLPGMRILTGKWWWIMEMVRGSLFSDVNPQMGFPAVDWNHHMANKHCKFWGSPCLLLKWFVSGYSRNLWRKSTGTSNSHIYIHTGFSFKGFECVCLLFQPPIVVASCGHCSFVHQVGWTPLQPHPGPKELLYGNFAPWPRWQARPGSGEVWCRLSTEIGWISIRWVLRHGSVGL